MALTDAQEAAIVTAYKTNGTLPTALQTDDLILKRGLTVLDFRPIICKVWDANRNIGRWSSDRELAVIDSCDRVLQAIAKA